ncbi:N-acetyltransferase [Hyunsoonleella flava]|uniref:N-acetyltransferase n=1 Tax=Hyunsoonleella flava TaxID=2527939 RepID=A0A4Q9FEF4_9FLAO|nr:GNAT family N-acetyltransferase [Hyunsoonleella flava]TBN01333.1 N-acetyltransferase [Hyunsoonleella flava]
MKIFETQRLILRELKIEDISSLFQILNDKDTMSYYPSTYDISGVTKWIEKNMNSYRENGFGLWAVLLKKNNQFIGQCGISLQNINGKIVPEIGYHINKNFWNNGYATESAKACLEFGFKNLRLDEIFIHTYIKNIASQRIAEKIGMTKLYEYEKLLIAHNVKWNHVVYSKKC